MRILLALVLSALLSVACSSGGTSTDSGAQASGDGAGGGGPSIIVNDFSFVEETTEAKVGEEVTWTVAEGSSPHTVKFDDEESKELAPGDTYTRTFNSAGEQKFVCGIHPGMSGTVTVK